MDAPTAGSRTVRAIVARDEKKGLLDEEGEDESWQGPFGRPTEAVASVPPGSILRFRHGSWERPTRWNLLDDLLRESAYGGRIALVAGEAGSASRRWSASSPAAADHGCACSGRLRPPGDAPDLGPLHDIGHQLGGRLAAQLRAAAAQEEIFVAFLNELGPSPTRPRRVVVVEDAHWADEATLDWLAFLGRRIGRLSALPYVTYRSDEVGPDHPLRGVPAALPHAVVRRVPIEPLSAQCVDEQARRTGRDGESIYRLAGATPFASPSC